MFIKGNIECRKSRKIICPHLTLKANCLCYFAVLYLRFFSIHSFEFLYLQHYCKHAAYSILYTTGPLIKVASNLHWNAPSHENAGFQG